MKVKNSKHIGNWIAWSSIILLLLIGTYFLFSLNESFVQRNLQRSVQKMDKEMQNLIDKGLNQEQLEKSHTGLSIFMSDTLVYWNRNDVSPKLMKRKVTVGHDTICSLLSGNYYVKSYERGSMTYYVYRTVNTTYQIENRYFENRIQSLPWFIDADIAIAEKEGGIALTNNENKVLTYYKITDKPRLKEPFRSLWFVPIVVLIAIVALLALGRHRKETPDDEKKTRAVVIGIGAVLIISIICTYIYHKKTVAKENSQMQQLAEKLMVKRDEGFEKSYLQFAEQLKNDTSVREMLFAESNVLADVILGYSKELLFDETMKAYNATLTLCAPGEEINIQPEGLVTECEGYFLEKLGNNRHERVGDGLYFMDYYTLDPNYLGTIRIESKDTLQQKTLYFEFYKPIAPEGFGFPQLLQEANSQTPYDYSVGSYRDNQLVYKYGRYVYPNFLNSLKVRDKEYTFSRKYKHYAIIVDDNNAIVVSTPSKSWTEITAPFAVFFLGLLLPYLLILWLIRPKEHRKWRDRSLRSRLQTVVFLTLGISLLVIGPVSIVYMQTLYNKKTTANQFDTTRTLSIEMRNDHDIATTMRTASRERWNEILQQYTTTFFTDLNLYNLNGQLIATTRPEIYDLHLLAPLMDPEAYQNIHKNKELYYTHAEHLGKGTYESAYIPLSDDNGNTLAYLNTPYFTSSTDLHKEIRDFILTYLNIIIVLLGIALLLILLIARRLTKPLALIQDKLRHIKIDQKNEHIEWEGDDEIGELVEEYNKLIDKLDESVAELKRTTTESAWREVARQVAHEIKNSLTPMRLSVQMLQRNIENGKATTQQIQSTANTLIEQIDSLSNIASSFSSYAKMPENHPAPFDLAELVGNVVNLYDNVDNIEFHYDHDPSVDHTFVGDKTHLNSAVSNLVKNAVQAIGSKPNGRIEVALRASDKAFVISVKDNGKGIKDEDKEKIFLPNFTTKTGGSGVGLSLTFNIVQSAGGTITFESQEGEGAEFIIQLPKQ